MINQEEFKKYQDSFREQFPDGGFENKKYVKNWSGRIELANIFKNEFSESIKSLPEERDLRLKLADSILKFFRQTLPGGYRQDLISYHEFVILEKSKDDEKVEFVNQLSLFLYGEEELEKRIDNFFAFLRDLKDQRGYGYAKTNATATYSFYLYLLDPTQHMCINNPSVTMALNLLQNKKQPKDYGLARYNMALDLASEVKIELENSGWKPSGRDIDLIDVRQFLWTHYEKIKNQKDSDVENLTETKQSSLEEEKEMKNIPLNQILYGPPGTGKTYQTVNRAVEILDTEFYENQETHDPLEARKALKERFDELRREGRIAQVTFHQSFSYEDFVEGLKASSEDGQINYHIENGVFKKICLLEQSIFEKTPSESIDISNRTVWKMSLGKRNEEEHIYKYCIKNREIRLGHGGAIDFSQCQNWNDIRDMAEKNSAELDSVLITMIDYFRNQMKLGDLVVISQGREGFTAIGEVLGEYMYEPYKDQDDFAHVRTVKWHCVWGEMKSHKELITKVFDRNALYKLDEVNQDKLVALLYDSKRVLIIDEINRGNISSIFGELITLIEPDKRKGNREELEVILPYSKDTFSVPNDLYIIGTMNTADRSLALLDTALRRRFEFEEIPPNPSLLNRIVVDGVEISRLFETMNKRIEALYNRDHLLGHSFFMGLDNNSTIADLRRIFERHVLPTLEEYFFEDWGKIQKVLGDHLKEEQQKFIIRRFKSGEIKGLLGDDHESEDEERHFCRNESALDDPAAYIGIYAPE